MIRYKNFTLIIVAVITLLLLISGCAPSEQSILDKYAGGES